MSKRKSAGDESRPKRAASTRLDAWHKAEQAGLQAVDIAGDGDCFFASVLTCMLREGDSTIGTEIFSRLYELYENTDLERMAKLIPDYTGPDSAAGIRAIVPWMIEYRYFGTAGPDPLYDGIKMLYYTYCMVLSLDPAWALETRPERLAKRNDPSYQSARDRRRATDPEFAEHEYMLYAMRIAHLQHDEDCDLDCKLDSVDDTLVWIDKDTYENLRYKDKLAVIDRGRLATVMSDKVRYWADPSGVYAISCALALRFLVISQTGAYEEMSSGIRPCVPPIATILLKKSENHYEPYCYEGQCIFENEAADALLAIAGLALTHRSPHHASADEAAEAAALSKGLNVVHDSTIQRVV